MSIALEFDDEDPKKTRKNRMPSSTSKHSKPAQSGNAQPDAADLNVLQTISDTLSAVWVQVLEVKEVLSDLKRSPSAETGSTASTSKDFYTTEEFAAIADLLPDTVTTYCRLGKLNATKTVVGRGATGEWRLSHAERLRYEKEGLLREDRPRRKPPRRFSA